MRRVSCLTLEFHGGSIKNAHPDLIDFRKEYMKPGVPQISPGKLRRRHQYIEAVQRFHSSQLMTDSGPYNDQVPTLTGKHRDRKIDSEINSTVILKFKTRRDSAIEGAIKNKILSLEPASEKPFQFRTENSSKWVGKKTMNFNQRTRNWSVIKNH